MKMKAKIKYLMPVVIVIFLVITAGLMTYHKPHKSVANIKPDYVTNANLLFEEYTSQEDRANDKYLDKVIMVQGEIKEITNVADDRINITLETGDEIFGVSCTFEKNEHFLNSFQIGDEINIKGRCAGMLMDVVLINCVTVK
jgi:hypothetical protein